MLLSRDSLVFVGRRIRMPPGMPKWQMPQGGIDAGETPRHEGRLPNGTAAPRDCAPCRQS